jgi:putative transposase
MKRKRYSDEQIAFALRQAEGGTAVDEICRRMGVSEATCLMVEEALRWHGRGGDPPPKQLEEENAKLKRLVADLTLDKTMLQLLQGASPQARLALSSAALGSGRVQRGLEYGLHIESALRWPPVPGARRASPSCAGAKASPRQCITAGRRNSWNGKRRLAGDTARNATPDEVKELRREAGALEAV